MSTNQLKICFLALIGVTIFSHVIFSNKGSLSEQALISLSGQLLELNENSLLLGEKSGKTRLIHLSEATQFEHHLLNLEGEFLELSMATKRVPTLDDDIELSVHQLGDEFFAKKVISFETVAPVAMDTANLSSEFVFLMDQDNGRTLLDIGANERMYPASMTKVMTTLVAIQNLESLSELVFINPSMFAELQLQNAAMAGFPPGAWVNALDLLYGIMLPSGGEATLAIAEHVGGSVEGFVTLMNQKAQELGMVDTQFTNPIGLHDEFHYTTAREMAVLLNYALQNEIFRQIFTSATHTTTSGTPLTSTLFGPIPRTTVSNGEIIGGRTGFTFAAGRCLISLASINGNEYILVTGGAPNLEENRILHLLDALYIFDQI